MSLYNLARMTTTTTGTGTITLGSAVSGFLSFADAGASDGETVTYSIRDGANSEIGRGTYTSSGTTLSRSDVDVLASTNSNNRISLSGSAEVFITPAAEDIAHDHESHDWATYSETIIWSATTAPSGSADLEYSWHRVGKNVTLRIRGEWATPGTDVLFADFPIPSDVPDPSYATGVGTNSAYGAGAGYMLAGDATSVTSTERCWLRRYGTDPNIRIIGSSKSADTVFVEAWFTAI